jgi:hypothetical protein
MAHTFEAAALEKCECMRTAEMLLLVVVAGAAALRTADELSGTNVG